MYATAFDSVGCLDKLEDFLLDLDSVLWIPQNTSTIELKRTEPLRYLLRGLFLKSAVQTFPHRVSFSVTE